jgi:hypothetical protein
MKQFQKYGVAAAVASIATGALATSVSKNEAGDLAIIPYYTVVDGKNTGMHIINTTNSTQVVKVRLRRGADSKDALDFNLVMSPYDEWTANIGAGGDTGVQVTTNDTTCTVPEFPNGVAQMPGAFAEGATEGYVEIIGMAEAANELQSVAVYAKHKKGVPVSCALVREHFYRVAGGKVSDEETAGVHTSALTNGAYCNATAVAVTANSCYNATAAADAISAGTLAALSARARVINLANFADTPDDAFKVSWMITDSTGGLEIGDNAVMVRGFASAPMMTNQQPLSFTTAGALVYDPLNFELPNLAYGAWTSTKAARISDADASIVNGSMFDDLRAALDTGALINDWAGFEAADGSTVATDWVITLPGQYAMNNPICDFYGAYSKASATAMACVKASTATKGAGYATATKLNNDELPLLVSGPETGNAYNDANSNLVLWDREEADQAPDAEATKPGLGFSPSGEGTAASPRNYLWREVNVISFNESDVLGSAELQSADGSGFGLRAVVTVADAEKGWAAMEINGSNPAPKRWKPDAQADDSAISVNTISSAAGGLAIADAAGDNWGTFTPVAAAGATMAIGFAAWERSFADQAGNYGRAIEHTTVSSLRS